MATRHVIVDTGGIEDFQRQLALLGDEVAGEFLESCTKEMAGVFLNDVTDNTPVDRGTLKGNWTLSSTRISRGNCKITVRNPMEYASYVEYGHRTRGGKGMVKGKRFMRNAEKRIKSIAPRMLQKRLEQKINEVLK